MVRADDHSEWSSFKSDDLPRRLLHASSEPLATILLFSLQCGVTPQPPRPAAAADDGTLRVDSGTGSSVEVGPGGVSVRP